MQMKKELNLNKNLNLLVAPTVEKDYLKYLFQVQTKPNGGIYEFEIEIEKNVGNNNETINDLKNVPIFNNNLISRINKYSHDEHCIHNDFPDLRQFCYCRIKFVAGAV